MTDLNTLGCLEYVIKTLVLNGPIYYFILKAFRIYISITFETRHINIHFIWKIDCFLKTDFWRNDAVFSACDIFDFITWCVFVLCLLYILSALYVGRCKDEPIFIRTSRDVRAKSNEFDINNVLTCGDLSQLSKQLV